MNATISFVAKAKFLFISFLSIILVKAFLKFLPLNTVIKKVKGISKFFLTSNDSRISIEIIHRWYLRLNKYLNIKSCFVNALVQKIIFSFFGHNILIVCGVKFDTESNFKGHAWLCYKNNVFFEASENLNDYVESFRV